MIYYQTVLWIRSGFNPVPVPDEAFYLNADSDPDLDPCKTLKLQKVEFFK
jgi:hypothetical protein